MASPPKKPPCSVSSDDNIEAQAAHDFVSRGALKLQKGLAYFDYDVRDGVFVDIGASTGGFTDVLLRHGAARVYAVDVGQDQLHDSLLRDRRVENMAAVNARHLAARILTENLTVWFAMSALSASQKHWPDSRRPYRHMHGPLHSSNRNLNWIKRRSAKTAW